MLALLSVAALASSLVAVATIGADRWGHAVGGVLSAFPLIVGPVLLLAAHHHGESFAAKTAAATLLGMVSVAAFALAYTRSAVRWSWLPSLLIAWAAAAAMGVAAGSASVGIAAATLLACLAILGAGAGVPRPPQGFLVARAAPNWDLPARMSITALMIVILTLAADQFGPVVAGVLSGLPVLASVLAVFTHRNHGPAALIALLRGMVAGLGAFIVFCAIVGALVSSLGVPGTFGLATAAAIAVQFATALRTSDLAGA